MLCISLTTETELKCFKPSPATTTDWDGLNYDIARFC